MSEREELAAELGERVRFSPATGAAIADHVLASPWLRAHDDRIRAEALAPVLAELAARRITLSADINVDMSGEGERRE